MKVTVISDEDSWMNAYIPSFVEALHKEHHVTTVVHRAADILTGDLAFYLGCGQLISADILKLNRHNLVIHESALPRGKGWSPLSWQILEGANKIPITLFEAFEQVDSGPIYLQEVMNFNGTELIDELREAQAQISLSMCLKFVHGYPDITSRGVEQRGKTTYYPRRNPTDSRLNPDKTIREQFNLLRIVDNARYPAFFELHDETYIIKIEKKRMGHSE